VTFKYCNGCGNTYPKTTEYFYRRGNTVTSRCKGCTNSSNKRWYDNNKSERNAHIKEYRRVNAERLSEQRRLRYQSNKEHELARNRAWYLRNKTARDMQIREYQRNNRKYIQADRAKCQRRRARKAALPNTLTADQWISCIDYFGGCCAVCGRNPEDYKDITLALDHWIPLASPHCLGTVVNNVLPLCHGTYGCNNRKGAIDPVEWLYATFESGVADVILHRIETYFDRFRAV
jgi:hypothetical protein